VSDQLAPTETVLFSEPAECGWLLSDENTMSGFALTVSQTLLSSFIQCLNQCSSKLIKMS
jgi:hypothetical protein